MREESVSWKTALLTSLGRASAERACTVLLASFYMRTAEPSSPLKVRHPVSIPCCVALGTVPYLSQPLSPHLPNEGALEKWAPVSFGLGSPASPGYCISGPSDNTALETSTECCHLLARGRSEWM